MRKSKTLLSLAVGESNCIWDYAQLLIFIRSLSPDIELHEDFLSMESLHGEDILNAVKKSCLESDFAMKCLRGLSTDGAPAMLGRQHGFIMRFTIFVAEE